MSNPLATVGIAALGVAAMALAARSRTRRRGARSSGAPAVTVAVDTAPTERLSQRLGDDPHAFALPPSAGEDAGQPRAHSEEPPKPVRCVWRRSWWLRAGALRLARSLARSRSSIFLTPPQSPAAAPVRPREPSTGPYHDVLPSEAGPFKKPLFKAPPKPNRLFSDEFLRLIPKVDLHVHLDGSLRLSTLIDLARENNIELPAYTVEGLREKVFRDAYKDLGEYLTCFKCGCCARRPARVAWWPSCVGAGTPVPCCRQPLRWSAWRMN